MLRRRRMSALGKCNPRNDSVAQISYRTGHPFPQTESSHGFRDGDAKGGVTIQDRDTNLNLRDLSVEVARHEALAQQFHAMHPLTDRVLSSNIPRGFVFTRLLRWYRLKFRQSARPRYFDARSASFLAMAPAVHGFHGWAFLSGGITAAAPRSAPLVHVNVHCRAVDGIVAFARVVCATRSHPANLLIARNLIEQMRQHRCISSVATRDLYRSDFQCLFITADADLAPDTSFGAAHCPAGYCVAMHERGSGDAAGPLNRDTEC